MNLIHRVMGMFPSCDREICHRIQFKQIWTGHAEKISHHQICRPLYLKIRKTVKYIKCISSLFRNHMAHRNRKTLKSIFRMKFIDFHTLLRLYQWFVIGETHINQISSVCDCLFHKGIHNKLVILKFRHLPDYIIPHTNIVKHVVHPWNS